MASEACWGSAICISAVSFLLNKIFTLCNNINMSKLYTILSVDTHLYITVDSEQYEEMVWLSQLLVHVADQEHTSLASPSSGIFTQSSLSQSLSIAPQT